MAGASGAAAAAPRLGYVLGDGPTPQMCDEMRAQAVADQKVYRAAMKAAAAVWKSPVTTTRFSTPASDSAVSTSVRSTE